MIDDSLAQYGSPLIPLDEDNIRTAKAPRLADQVATDKQGRRRFHGAFTGGYSAGFFNSVGSKEGWAPSTFVSSRSNRSDKLQKHGVTAYMDDEDLDDFGIASKRIQATSNYEDPQTQNKRKRDLEEWTGPIPGQPVLEDLLKPVNVTIGMQLLIKLGWRPGQGIGPRVSQREKKRTEKEIKPKGAPDSSSESEDECYHSTFAPNDVAEDTSMLNPKSDFFGLGYSPLERGNVLGAQFGTYKSQSLNLFEKKKKVSIRGQAFGVGAFEEEDESIYTKEDMSDYDFTLGPSADKKSRKRDKSRWDSQISLMGEVLEGFHLSSKPLPPLKVFPLPSLPKDFVPKHKSNRRRFERDENEPVERLSCDERKRLISSNPSVEIRSGVKKSEEERRREEEESERKPSSFQNTFTEHIKQEETESPSDYKPFASQPQKQKRYEAYMNAKGSSLKDVFPSSMTDWEKEREKGEFTRISAFNRPLSFAMSSRFTSATLDDKCSGSLSEGFNDMSKRKPGSEDDKKPTLLDAVLDEDMKAAKLKTFGRLTQTQCEWHPDKILCKRFNVPHPFPQSTCVGVPSRQKEKISIFNFLSSVPPGQTYFNTPQNTPSESQQDMEEDLMPETQDSLNNFGLKVPVSNPPTLDLFKAIFQDSSDSESDEEDAKTDSKEKKEETKEDTRTLPHSSTRERDLNHTKTDTNYRNRLRNTSSDDEKEVEVLSVKKALTVTTDDAMSRARGVFKGIDFAALNQYRHSKPDIKEEEESDSNSPRHEPVSRFTNGSKDEGKSKGTNSSTDSSDEDFGPMLPDEDEDDEYGPALPPHMISGGSVQNVQPLKVNPVLKEEGDLFKEIETKKKKAKKYKSKHSHKHKKKKSKKKDSKHHR